MKTTFLSLGLMGIAIAPALAQNCTEPQGYEIIDANNLSVGFRNAGDMFWDGTGNPPQFYHKLDSASTFFASALWLSGYDAGGNLCAAMQTYRSSGTDYWTGPLDPVTGTVSDTTCGNYDYIWKVERAAIEALRADFSDNQIIDNPIDPSLKRWPGRGNPYFFAEMGFHLPDQDLAPFYDENTDGFYNPEAGDYPVFKRDVATAVADQMLWMVFNDNGNIHLSSNANTMKAEVQLTVYSFECSSEPLLQNTIFTNHKIMSRNALTLDRVHFGMWSDFDLGCYNDDYLGIAPSINTVYAYNVDNNDEMSCGNVRGFGVNPPVQAVTLLNRSISHNYAYLNSVNPFAPSNSVQCHNIMAGLHPDGSPITYNGDTVDFIFDGVPSAGTGWTMANDTVWNIGGDMRSLFSVEIGDWLPGGVYELDMAYSYHRDISLQTPAEMVDLMLQQVPSIQQIYDDGFALPCTNFNIVEEVMDGKNGKPEVYPNPAQDELFIEFQEPIEHEVYGVVYDVLGRVAHRQVCPGGSHIIQLDNLNLVEGLYFYSLESEGKTLAAGQFMVK